MSDWHYCDDGPTEVRHGGRRQDCKECFRPSKFKLWYSHQVPGPSYEQEVPDAKTGQLILDAIYQVALYQFDNRMIPDYCNTGGIVYLDQDGEWTDYDPEEWEA